MASPSARGHHSAGRSIVTDQFTSLTPAASGWSTSWSMSPTSVRSRTRRAASLSSSARTARTARSGVASAQMTRRLAMRTGPRLGQPHRAPQPAGVPRRVDGVPVLEDAGDVPLGGRPVLRGARHLDGHGVLGPGAQGVGDLEAVGDEVALGVAQVAAVQPGVALVEEAVERQPGPAPRCGRGGVEAAAVEQGAVAVGERRTRPPVPRDADRVPVGVVEVGLGVRPAQVVVGRRGPPPVGQLADALIR